MPKLARVSRGLRDGEPYPCKMAWPDDCFCQAGGDGIVFTEGTLDEAVTNPDKAIETIAPALGVAPDPKGSYRTAFFEAFPQVPHNGQQYGTFIRGEGKSIEEAEQKCWARYQKHLACEQHDFDIWPQNGCVKCRRCGLFLSDVYEADLRRDDENDWSPLEVAVEAHDHGDDSILEAWVEANLERGKPVPEQLRALCDREYRKNGIKDRDGATLGLVVYGVEGGARYLDLFMDLDFSDDKDFLHLPHVVTDAILKWMGQEPPKPMAVGGLSQAAHDARKAKHTPKPKRVPLPMDKRRR